MVLEGFCAGDLRDFFARLDLALGLRVVVAVFAELFFVAAGLAGDSFVAMVVALGVLLVFVVAMMDTSVLVASAAKLLPRQLLQHRPSMRVGMDGIGLVRQRVVFLCVVSS